jgi:ABC-type antimicrobial peptide transport system permease subunit
MSRLFAGPDIAKTKDRNFFFSITTLARWRLRQTWLFLLMVGVGITAAVTIVCAVPLFTSLAEVTNLHDMLTVSPSTSELTLSLTTQGLSSGVEKSALQMFDPLMRNALGSYLARPAQLSIQTTGLHILAPAALQKSTPLNLYAASLDELKPYLALVQGNWPQDDVSDGVIDGMLTVADAQALHVSVGSLLTVQGDFFMERADILGGTNPDPRTEMRVRIAGLFEVQPQGTQYLHGETFQPVVNDEGTFYTLLMPTQSLLSSLDRTAQRSGIDAIFSPLTFQFNLYYELSVAQLQTSQVDDLVTHLTGLQAGVARVFKQYQAQQNAAEGTFTSPYLNQVSLYNPAPNSFEITTLLEQYSSRIALERFPPAILALLIMALIVFFIGLIVTLLVERQGETNAMLSSRGASSRQIFWSLLFQGILLCALALILGPLLAVLIVSVLATHTLSGSVRDALTLVLGQPAQLLLEIGAYILGTSLLALLTMGFLLRRATSMDVLALRQETARTTYRPLWMRYYFDVAAAVIALTAYALSLSFSGASRFLDPQAQSLILVPLALMAPLFLLIGCFLLFLRLFPLFLRIGAWLGRRKKGATAMLVLVQMERSPRQSLRLTMLLALATAFAVFTLVFAATQAQRAADISTFETGADFSGTLPAVLMRSSLRDTQAVAHLTAKYRQVRGVQSATVGYVDQGTANGIPVELRAVDAQTFGRTGEWSALDSFQSLPSLMQDLNGLDRGYVADGILPAIMDEAMQAELGEEAGADFILSLNNPSFTVEIFSITVVSHIPTVNSSDQIVASSGSDDSSPGGLLVDYSSLNTLYRLAQVRQSRAPAASSQNLPLNHVWLRTADDAASLNAVRAALNSSALALGNLYDRRGLAEQFQSDPMYLTILVVLSVGVATTLLLALVGGLLTSWLSVRARLSNFTVLRALGAAPGQVAALLSLEQGILYLLALLLGAAIGALLVSTIVPALIFTSAPVHSVLGQLSDTEFYIIQHIIPVQIIVPDSLKLILLALVALCILALSLMVRTVLRPAMSQELRLSVD